MPLRTGTEVLNSLPQRPRSGRDVTTAWKQLWCATDIARKAAGASTLEDIAYLTKEATAALNGISFGEGCRAAPAVPTIKPDAISVRAAALEERGHRPGLGSR